MCPNVKMCIVLFPSGHLDSLSLSLFFTPVSLRASEGCARIFRAEKKCSGLAGKFEFVTNEVEVVYVDLKPSTANISYVQSFVQELWGPQYIVVSNDGLPISDTAATRGGWSP